MGPVRIGYRRLSALQLLVILARLVVGAASGAGREWDFVNFYNAGSRTLRGNIDHLYIPATPPGRPPELRHVGLPLSAQALAPLGLVPPRPAMRVFKAGCSLCMALVLLLLRPDLVLGFVVGLDFPPPVSVLEIACLSLVISGTLILVLVLLLGFSDRILLRARGRVSGAVRVVE